MKTGFNVALPIHGLANCFQVLYGGDKSGANVCVPFGASGEWRWAQVAAAGPAPPDRGMHGAAVWGGAMVVFGGAAMDAGGAELSDVWWLRKQGSSWAWGAPGRHTPYVRWAAPSARPACQHAACTAGQTRDRSVPFDACCRDRATA
jgi:hypothetical protein